MSGISIKINGDNRDALTKIREVEGKIKEMKALEKLNDPKKYYGSISKMPGGKSATTIYGKGAEAFSQALSSQAGNLGKFGGILTKFIGAGGPYLAAVGAVVGAFKLLHSTLKGMAEKGKNAFNDFDRNRAILTTQMSVFAPGVDTSGIVKDFQVMAENGVNSVDELTSVFSKLLPVFGNNVDAAKDFVKMAANMQAATGISADSLAQLAERTLEAGEANKKDVDFLAKRGIPIYQELARVLGMDSAAVRQYVKENGIQSDKFIEALKKVGEAYKDTTSALSDTVEGAKASMEAARGRAYQGFAEGYGEAWKQYYKAEQEKFDARAADAREQANQRKLGGELAWAEIQTEEFKKKLKGMAEDIARGLGEASAGFIKYVSYSMNRDLDKLSPVYSVTGLLPPGSPLAGERI